MATQKKALTRKTPKKVSVFSVDKDVVVGALVATGRTSYEYAIAHLVPLIDRLDIQRKIQNPRFYDRLKRDIVKGCIMPPITLAFVSERQASLNTPEKFERYLTQNISNAFVLDGIQRLNTIKRASESSDFPLSQPLFLNILVCSSTDNLLYRMITLNNGQRPMTTRHQIEILTTNLMNERNSSVYLAKEKDGVRRQPGVFAKADFVLAYIAFLSNSTTVDSQKLIQEKLDELLASKILEHDPTVDGVQFAQITDLISDLTIDPEMDKWFKITNNLIGFCAGIRDSYSSVKKAGTARLLIYLQSVEESFGAFDVAKIKLGRARRNVVDYAIRNFSKLERKDVQEITEKLIEVIE